MKKLAAITLFISLSAQAQFVQPTSELNKDSVSIGAMANNGMLDTLPKAQSSAAPSKIIQLPPTQPPLNLFQCPLYSRPSHWTGPSCDGQIGYETVCHTRTNTGLTSFACTPIFGGQSYGATP